MAGIGLGVQSAISAEIAWLFLVGLPALWLGTWLGLRFYGRLAEARFRKIILFVLLLSGTALFFRQNLRKPYQAPFANGPYGTSDRRCAVIPA